MMLGSLCFFVVFFYKLDFLGASTKDASDSAEMWMHDMNIADMGKVLSSDSRVRILSALMGGQALPASELAFRAGVSNQTASEHLQMLEAASLISGRRCGRHRYYELKDPSVAQLLESFSVVFSAVEERSNAKVPERLRLGRFCYDHLAGRLGVALTRSMVASGALEVVERAYVVPSGSHPFFVNLGIDVDAVAKRRRHLAPQCIDWSERLPHLAGALGATVADRFLERGWITRCKDDRSVALTEIGKRTLSSDFDVGLDHDHRSAAGCHVG